jgi:dihydroorotate dehydrogenase (fumarate)
MTPFSFYEHNGNFVFEICTLKDICQETKDAVAAHKKPYIVSLSGLSLEDNMEMLDRIYSSPENISAIELNLACPNIPGKPVIAYDFEQMEKVLNAITSHPKYATIPLGVKVAPYFDGPHFAQCTDLICKYPVRYIVCINTVGNGLFVDAENECEAIAPRNGLGGLSGGFVKHTALANVRSVYRLLQERGKAAEIDVVGVGGVHCGRDAFELILCGARAVQIGTCHWTEGPGCFCRIAAELEGIMAAKGYATVEQFRGALKGYIKPSRTTAGSSTIMSAAATVLRTPAKMLQQQQSGSGSGNEKGYSVEGEEEEGIDGGMVSDAAAGKTAPATPLQKLLADLHSPTKSALQGYLVPVLLAVVVALLALLAVSPLARSTMPVVEL